VVLELGEEEAGEEEEAVVAVEEGEVEEEEDLPQLLSLRLIWMPRWRAT
jgi:hypothetical protein